MERFWEKVRLEDNIFPENGCMLWVGTRNPLGYGQLRIDKKIFPAYRWIYEYFYGPVPEDLELDHLCRNPSCVNPDHLEAVPHRVNIQTGKDLQPRKTHCPHGHEYTVENTYHYRGCRTCIRCRNERSLRWYHQRKHG